MNDEVEIKKKKRKESRIKLLIDAVLLTIAFAAAYWLKRGSLDLDYLYARFLPFFYLSWFLSTFLSGKFKSRWRPRKGRSSGNRLSRLAPYTVSLLFFAGMLSVLLSTSQWTRLSRIIVFSSLAIHFMLEILFLTNIFVKQQRRKEDRKRGEFSILFFLLEFVLVSAGIFSLQYYKFRTLKLTEENLVVLASILFIWMVMGILNHKFHPPTDRNYLRALWPFLRSWFFILFGVFIIIFISRMDQFAPLVYGSLAGVIIFELLVVTIYYLYNKPRETDFSRITLIQSALPEKQQVVQEVIQKERTESQEYQIPNRDFKSRFIREKLKYRYLRRSPRIFQFIDHVLDLKTIDIINAEVLDSSNPYNIEILEDNSLEFLLNLHQLNTYGHIDEYLIDVNQKLKENGFFISKFQPLEFRLRYFRRKYPYQLANILYGLDTIWRQIFPKLPFLRKIYFILSRGRNRVISLAEGFGRLYFCGFEIVSLEEVDDYLFFIVKKAKDPYTWFKYFYTFDRVPNYGILFKQKRIGKGKSYINIYKLQTMYPYSEFIHEYVMQLNELADSGKVRDDFRITTWGRIFRRLWIDELPMIMNLLKGDLKLVGVRPLSETFFNTYPKELQDLRTRWKPGLIPPYYADLPKNMAEVRESERRYLERYGKSPLFTDFIYFWKAFKNIVFKGAKSG